MDKLVTLGLVEKVKNSDSISESKMAELKENSKQPDRPDTEWKLCFTMETNE